MDQETGSSSLRLKLRITFSIVGVLVGFGVFPCFAFVFHNWSAGIWALVSGIVAFWTLIVHILHIKLYWQGKVRHLERIMLCGCFIQLAGVCGFVTYLTLALVERIEFNVYGRNLYVVLVWCFMTLKWGFALFYYARYYRDVYTKRRPSLQSLLGDDGMPNPVIDKSVTS